MISIKTPEELAQMREGGRLLARIVTDVSEQIAPGVSTATLDRRAEQLICEGGATPAFKGYQGFPATTCISINNEVVHAVPSEERVLREGDVVTLDLGLVWKGWYLDMARTYPVGAVSAEAKHLVETTKKALRLALKKVRSGNTVGDIGNTVERFVTSQGYHAVHDLCGHGIGRALHEDPQILNFGKRHKGVTLREGMVIAIEPIVGMTTGKIKEGADGHSFVTADGGLSAHFEDTIAVLAEGAKVLTDAR